MAVGHVTADVLSEGHSRRPGGGAFYSALQAARMGLRTLILTRGEPGELGELLAPYAGELDVLVLPSEHTTTMLTTGSGAGRSQRVLAWAGPITEDIEVDTAILHLAPVARETPARWRGDARFVGVTPQGLVREWDSTATGTIKHVPLARSGLPEHFDAVVISQVELESCRWLLAPAATPLTQTSRPGHSGETERPLVVVTAGSAPITIHSSTGTWTHAPALTAADPKDDLGAGDVFAAALFVALSEGRTPSEAVAYGNAAAAVRLAGVGPAAVGDRRAVLLQVAHQATR